MWRCAAMLILSLFVFSMTSLAENRPRFRFADQNGNGKVSINEAIAAGVPIAEARAGDRDNDGQLTRDDWRFIDMNTPSNPESLSS